MNYEDEEYMDEETVPVPAGSTPMDADTSNPDKAKGAGKEAPQPTPIKVGDKEYQSADELAKAYSNLEKKLGEQGKELGDVKKQHKALMDQMAQPAKQPEQPPPTDWEAMLQEVKKGVDDGKISIEEALFKSNQITAQMVEERAVNQSKQFVQNQLMQEKAKEVQKDFLKRHPDFLEMRDSGAFEAIKEETPLLDDISAYFVLKGRNEYERGKMEHAAVKDGAAQTDKVLTKPGTTIRQENKPKPRNAAEMKQSMLSALRRSGQEAA